MSKFLTSRVRTVLGTLGLTALGIIMAPQFAGDRPPIYLPADHDETAADTVRPIPPTFDDATLDMGLFHEHRQESHDVSDVKDVLGAGLCIGDIDGDHLDDLIFTTGAGVTRDYGRPAWWLRHSGVVAYLNRSSYFEDRTQPLGLQMQDATMGCLLTDLDADGYNDLVVTSFRGAHLYYNEGGTRFVAAEDFAADHTDQWTTSATAHDIDGDGLLDLFLTGYLNYTRNQSTHEPGAGFSDATQRSFDPRLYNGQQNLVFINRGDRTFIEASSTFFAANDLDRSLGAIWLDANRDGNDDLLVLNGDGSQTRLYLHDHVGRFVESTSMVEPFRLVGASHAVSNGRGELLITRPLGLGHVYLRASTDGMHSDHSWAIGVNTSRSVNFSAWGAATADFNLDGAQDFFLATGMRRPDAYSHNRSLSQPNILLLARGNEFEQIIGVAPERAPGSSRSVGSTDLNLDGRPDVIVTNNNGPPQLLMNATATSSSWIGIHAPGSPVLVTLEQGDWRSSVALGNRPLFLGSEQGYRIVALPAREPTLVTWIDGEHVTQQRLDPDRHYVHADGVFIPILPPDSTGAELAAENDEVPRFVQEAQVLSRMNGSGRLSPEEVGRIGRMLERMDPELRRRLLGVTPRLELLPVYLALLDNDDETTVLAALDDVRRLESDLSTDYLLRRLKDPHGRLVCPVSELFAHWYREEEAATKSKFLAVPYLIRLLSHADAESMACAARALAESEHLTAAPALMAAYGKTESIPARRSLVEALGAIRQRQAGDFLEDRFDAASDSSLQVTIAIALNRLEPRLGDEKMQALNSSAMPLRRGELLAQLLYPEHRVHFLPATIQAFEERLLGDGDRIWPNLSNQAQITLADRLGRRPDAAALSWGVQSPRPFLSGAALRLLDGISRMPSTLALSLIDSPAWPTVSVDVRRSALHVLPADEIAAMAERPDRRVHVLGSISLLARDQTLALLRAFERLAGSRELEVDPRACRGAAVGVTPADVRSLGEGSALSPLNAALVAPSLAARLTNRDFRSWTETTLTRPPGEADLMLACLADLDVTEEVRRRLNLTILSLPEELEALKQLWLVHGDRADPIIASGIDSRLRQQDQAFAHRYLLARPAAAIEGPELDLLAAYPAGSPPAQFAELMRSPASISQVR